MPLFTTATLTNPIANTPHLAAYESQFSASQTIHQPMKRVSIDSTPPIDRKSRRSLKKIETISCNFPAGV